MAEIGSDPVMASAQLCRYEWSTLETDKTEGWKDHICARLSEHPGVCRCTCLETFDQASRNERWWMG
jgi:hypothetical protein